MNISLPDQMKSWVEAQTEDGRFGNASDYVRDLIRRDQERQGKIHMLQRLIDAGLQSGISPRGLEEILADARTRHSRLATFDCKGTNGIPSARPRAFFPGARHRLYGERGGIVIIRVLHGRQDWERLL